MACSKEKWATHAVSPSKRYCTMTLTISQHSPTPLNTICVKKHYQNFANKMSTVRLKKAHFYLLAWGR